MNKFCPNFLSTPVSTRFAQKVWNFFAFFSGAFVREVLCGKVCPELSLTVWARLRKDLAIREFEDLKNDKVTTTLQFKQRVSQILTPYGCVHPGKKYSYLETLLRGTPKRLVKCKNNKHGPCGK